MPEHFHQDIDRPNGPSGVVRPLTSGYILVQTESSDVLKPLLRLPREHQLNEAIRMLCKASEGVEDNYALALAVSRYVESTELWNITYTSLGEFRKAIRWYEDIAPLVESGNRSEMLLANTRAQLLSHWGCDLESLFEPIHQPPRFSKHLLEAIKRLCPLCPREIGVQKVMEAVNTRGPRTRGSLAITQMDVRRAIDLVKIDLSQPLASPQGDFEIHPPLSPAQGNLSQPLASPQGDLEIYPLPSPAQEAAPSKICTCPSDIRDALPRIFENQSDEPIEETLAIAQKITKDTPRSTLCHPHLRKLAGKGFGLYTNRSAELLVSRMRTALSYAQDSSVRELRRKKKGWFRSAGRNPEEDPEEGLWRWKPLSPNVSIAFSAQQVFQRFAGPESWDAWLKDGNIIIPDVFGYLSTEGLFNQIDSEYNAYRYHTKPKYKGKARNGWTRTMFYSLIQQLVRQDPLYYAVMVAARPDQNWRLISYPYYTKDTTAGERTGFKHLDLNVPALLADGRGANIIQSTVSLDDEEEDGCTILVPGFHRSIGKWWARVEQRGTASNSLTTNVSKTYLKEDEKSFGSFVPVPCPRGGIRITRPEIIHGSTSISTRRRRTIFVWHCGINEDHQGLDNPESETWDEVSKCHRDMEMPLKSTSGYGFAYGKPGYRFPASTRLAAGSAIGEAMIGLRRWDEPSVLKERDILLGPDDAKAWDFVKEVRKRLVEHYRVSFDIMVEQEKASFGCKSFFADPVRSLLREAQNLDEDLEGDDTGSGGSDME